MNAKQVLLSIACTAVFLGCKGLEVNSRWLDRDITIDGSDAEWNYARMYLEKANVSIGLLNDRDQLYVCLASSDRYLQMQMMRQGLIVWFDPSGGKGKTFGIYFPVGIRGPQIGQMHRERDRSSPDPGQMGEMFQMFQNEVEILGPGKKDRQTLPLKEANGIEVKIGLQDGKFTYEMKIPLVRNERFPYAVGIDSRRIVSIGFETPAFDMEGMRSRRGGFGGGSSEGGGPPGGGGMPPPGGMGPGGRRGRPGGERFNPSMPEAFKLWMKVKLASSNSPVNL